MLPLIDYGAIELFEVSNWRIVPHSLTLSSSASAACGSPFSTSLRESEIKSYLVLLNLEKLEEIEVYKTIGLQDVGSQNSSLVETSLSLPSSLVISLKRYIKGLKGMPQ